MCASEWDCEANFEADCEESIDSALQKVILSVAMTMSSHLELLDSRFPVASLRPVCSVRPVRRPRMQFILGSPPV
jgi:hypothetical protein